MLMNSSPVGELPNNQDMNEVEDQNINQDQPMQADQNNGVDLNVKISDSEMQKLAHRLYYEITRYDGYVQTRRGNVEQYRRDWEAFPSGRSVRW